MLPAPSELCEHLTAPERYLVEQRVQGRGWQELAEELQTTPQALRQRLTRALDRVLDELRQKQNGSG